MNEGVKAQADWTQFNRAKDEEAKQKKIDLQKSLFAAYNEG